MSADAPGLDAPAILAIFDSHQVEYVVVGGYAANLHGSTRVTIDIDVIPNRTLRNLARLAAALRDLGGGIRVDDLDHGLAFDASPESLADRMGHAQITTPKKYLHALPDADAKNLTALDRIRRTQPPPRSPTLEDPAD